MRTIRHSCDWRHGIPAQRKLLNEYAKLRQIRVLREFIDVEPAKASGRAAFGQMIVFLKKHSKVRVILVEKTDRLYRNVKDWVTLDDLELEIHFVKENVAISRESRSSEEFMHRIKVLMAKNYCDNLSEETRKGMTEKAEQGIWPSCAPIGYLNVTGDRGKRVILLDSVRGPLVTRMFELYATGDYSLRQIARWAKSAGLTFRKSGRAVNRATIQVILRNRIYTGDFDWDGKTYKGVHEPLVSRELWEKVQDTLDHRFSHRHRVIKHDFPFSGLIRCGHCGCALVGELKKKRYIYYHCTGQKGSCGERYVRQELLEQKFTDTLRALSIPTEVVELARDAFRDSQSDDETFHAEAISRLTAEHDAAEAHRRHVR